MFHIYCDKKQWILAVSDTSNFYIMQHKSELFLFCDNVKYKLRFENFDDARGESEKIIEAYKNKTACIIEKEYALTIPAHIGVLRGDS